MKLISLKVIGLHGYISHEINFNKDITILVGINGSGKTSIFHLINNILQFNIPKLAITKLEKAELIFNWDKKKHVITLTPHDNKLWIHLIVAKKTYHKIFVSYQEEFAKLARNPELNEGLLESYSRLRADEDEGPTWRYLKDLKKPTFLSLERNVITEDIDFNMHRNSRRSSAYDRTEYFADNSEYNDAVGRSSHACKSVYVKYRNELDQLNAELNKRLALALFDDPIYANSNRKNVTTADINKLEQKVLSHPSFLAQNDELNRKRIHNHFLTTKKLINDAKNTEINIDWNFVLKQRMHSINMSIEAFDSYDAKATEAGKPINNYLKTLNSFFAGSGKNLFFLEEDNGLYFESRDDPESFKRDVRTLSSGEKQLFILFSHLAFLSKNTGLLMIDEPEVSLHPSWQQKFAEAIGLLRPANCQVILATHSPEIAGKNREKTIVL